MLSMCGNKLMIRVSGCVDVMSSRLNEMYELNDILEHLFVRICS